MRSLSITALLLLCSFVRGSETSAEKNIKIVSKSWVGAGFFAELRNVVYNLIYRCDHKVPKTLIVDWTQEFFPYKDDPLSNGWDLYFEPIPSEKVFANRSAKRPPEPYHDNPHCIERWIQYSAYLPYRQFIHDRLNAYIAIKKEILEKTDAFFSDNLAGHYCIGIHVRFAAAHSAENPLWNNLKLEDYIREAQELIAFHKDENPKIFLATDSHFVVEAFLKVFDHSQLAFTDAFRAQYDQDPHLIYEKRKYYLAHPEEFHMRKPGFNGGVMTLIDCLLLSKCHVIVHSLSNVPEFATWFNPHLQSVFLPKTATFAPCSCDNLLRFFQ